MRYLTGADARMRLHASYCQFDGVPVFVKVPHDMLAAEIIDLKSESVITTIDPNDERLDIESLPLGYLDFVGSAAFASRLPYRQQKQGISNDNTKVTHEKWLSQNRYADHFGGVPFSIAGKMFRNEYREFEDARRRIESGGAESIPFNRKLCIVTSKEKKSTLSCIRYAGKTMGFLFKGKKAALISDQFSDPVFRILLSKHGIEHEILPSESEDDGN
jgi:hypothetical protein